MTLPKALSPLPWTYRTDDDGWRDWIEDAVGNVVVENIGVIDGPFIVERANAALSQPGAQAVPEGWKLVPIEPTEAMMDAHFATHARADTVFAEVKDIWAAMLAASPATGGA